MYWKKIKLEIYYDLDIHFNKVTKLKYVGKHVLQSAEINEIENRCETENV